MSLKYYCPNCHAFVQSTTQFCKACGETVLEESLLSRDKQFEPQDRKNFKVAIWVFVAFIIGLAAIAWKIFYEVMSGLAAGH
jgi:predicted amidophosphoribosyltransferase